MGKLYSAGGYELDIRGFTHAFLAILVLLLLLLKISFVRFYQKYRPYVPLLGMIVAIGAFTVWLIAGWFFLIILGNVKPG